jgi:hypothetical protein
MARKLRGSTTMEDVRAGEAERNKPIVLRNSTETYSINQPDQSSIGGNTRDPSSIGGNTRDPSSIGGNTRDQSSNFGQSSIRESYDKMVGQYEPDIAKYTAMLPSANQFTGKTTGNGFYGSMSGLEAASMRLANAASQRSMAEAGYGSGLKRGETANEYGLRDISTAKEYGLKGGLLSQEYGLKDTSMAKEYGLKDTSMAKEYGLTGGLLDKEYGLKSSQFAQTSGYSSPFQMQQDLQKERNYQRAYQNALASGKKGTYSGSWGSFRI